MELELECLGQSGSDVFRKKNLAAAKEWLRTGESVFLSFLSVLRIELSNHRGFGADRGIKKRQFSH